MLADLGHPFARGEPVYDVTFENVQAGLRTDYLFRLANQHGGLVVGTGDLSELALGWCTYGVGDQMSHYNVNASVSKTLIQHLIRFVAASGDVDTATVATSCRPSWRPKSRRSWCRPTPPARSSPPSRSSAPTRCRTSTSTTSPVTASGRRRSPSSRSHAWEATPSAAPGRRTSPTPRGSAYALAEIKSLARGLPPALLRPSQFKRSAMPNGPKISSGGSLSPRGDWRAPSDGNATVWLAELAANVPDE